MTRYVSSASVFPPAARRLALSPWLLSALDVVAVLASAVLAYVLVAWIHRVTGEIYEDPWTLAGQRWQSAVLTLGGIGLWFLFKGHYHRRMPFWTEAREVVQACAFALLCEGFLLYSGKSELSRQLLFASWIATPGAVMAFRHVAKSIAIRCGHGVARVLVVGSEGRSPSGRAFLEADRHMGYQFAGYAAFDDLQTLFAEIRERDADAVLAVMSGASEFESEMVAGLKRSGVPVMVMPPLMGLQTATEVHYVLGDDAIVLVDRVDAVPLLSRAAKRAFDVVLSAVALTVLACPMALVAWLVARDGGPAIYGHERVGEGGRSFSCLKFRSMRPDAQEKLAELLSNDADARLEWEASRKLKNDPRVTRIGRILRKSGIDELPQLWNVLRGDMSLVGPRPVTASEIAEYGEAAEQYLSVKPGITGLWQVSGRSDTTYAQRVSLDAWYVANWSPWHDTVILLKTVPAVLSRRGAY